MGHVAKQSQSLWPGDVGSQGRSRAPTVSGSTWLSLQHSWSQSGTPPDSHGLRVKPRDGSPGEIQDLPLGAEEMNAGQAKSACLLNKKTLSQKQFFSGLNEK